MARPIPLGSADLNFFAAIASAPSLAAASRSLDVSRSAVTQRLSQLEARLGCRLLDRTTRHLRLTEEGHLLLERAHHITEELNELSAILSDRRDVVTGHLRIAAPLGFGRRYIAPITAAFKQRNPEVTISLTLTDRPATFDENTCDLIIHIGELRNSSRVMVRLAANDRIVCASPRYLQIHGEPANPAQLASHVCLALRQNEEDVTLWRFMDGHGKTTPVRVAPAMSSNDGETIRSWALEGLGIMIRSEWHVADDLAAGRLKRVLTPYRLPPADVAALVGKRSGRAARVNAFLRLLQERFRPNPWRPVDR